jgi:hypothetical protein
VHIDGDAAVRRSLSASLGDEDGTLAPRLATDYLSPYGNELVVRSGYVYPDGDVEVAPVGVFRIEESGGDSAGLVEIEGFDRSIVVSLATFEVPYVIAAGTNLGDAVHDLVDSRYPGLTYVLSPTSKTVPLTVFEESLGETDPWQEAQRLAASGSMELFFDAEGRVVMRPVPDPTTDPSVWNFSPGPDNIFIGGRNRLNARLARNVAIVTGEGTGVDTPVRGVAEITDAASPIFPGTFGRRPVRLTTPLIGNDPVTAQAEADAAAQALLQRRAGGSEQLTFSAVPNPAHEAGDVVRVDSDALGLDVFVVLSSWDLDVGLKQASTYTTQARRTAT